jgi:hypothetical protein
MYAVDRSCRAESTNAQDTTLHPFNLTVLDVMKPQTLFVMICDIWRNTIRGLVQPETALQFDNASTMPLISTVDCMGPSNYNNKLAWNDTYFKSCSLSAPVTTTSGLLTPDGKPWPQNEPGTPWTITQDDTLQLWNPFLGGTTWNSLLFQSSKTTPALMDDYLFPPTLWYPTYQWSLSNQNSSNVSITSVASNDTLSRAGECLFSCSDGTIRKINLKDPTYPVIEMTTGQTFLNGSINLPGSQSSVNYVWPGRLYNLTYWANNWWCTADNASIWTTAPVADDNGIIIELNQTAALAGFNSSLVTFRPLSTHEGHPSKWANATWPQNLAHKFNVMKIIDYGGKSDLFISSIDGEYIVLANAAAVPVASKY